MPEGGSLTISTERVHLDETYARMYVEAKPIDYVVLKVEDTGTRMAPPLVEKIFDPFFTTKDPGKGTGLGLSTAHTIVKSHGGLIKVYSEVGKGSSFNVYLPIAAQVTGEEAQPVESDIPMGEGELILVVDDEEAIREIARQILEAHGFGVATAGDMDGKAMVRALRKIDPDVRIIATSGLVQQGQSSANLGVQEVLIKPHTAETLLGTLRRVLDSRRY